MESSKYGKWHYVVAVVEYYKEMIEESSRCLLQKGSEASNQKSKNVKSSATPMPTHHLIFVIIGPVKLQLFPQKLWTCSIPLQRCGNWNFTPFLNGGFKIWETALYCCNCLILQRNDWTELALLAAKRLRSLESKIRKRQIVGNANAHLPSNFHHHRLH